MRAPEVGETLDSYQLSFIELGFINYFFLCKKILPIKIWNNQLSVLFGKAPLQLGGTDISILSSNLINNYWL